MDFRKLIETDEYEFLRTSPRLGRRVILLGVSGSYGYGTNREGSDIDLRGVTLNLPSDLIGLTGFAQYEDRQTDTVIYAFNKLITLLLDCNPNTIEILGLDQNQYPICTPLGRELLDNRRLFLSKRAASSFGHYAEAQLRRLQNAIARDALPQQEKERHILNAVTHALEDFNRRHGEESRVRARLYADTAQTEGLEAEIFLDAVFQHYPLREFNSLTSSLGNVLGNYEKLGRRNHKKDENHLNKHAMHLIRLFMMGIDILAAGEIRTHRPEDDLKLLLAIRDGEYMENGTLKPEFYDIVSDYENRFASAVAQSALPDSPDMEQIEAFVEQVNRCAIEEEFE